MSAFTPRLRDIQAEKARRRLLDFTTWTKPDYQIGRPHRILGAYLDRLVSGEITRLIVQEPPRHGKSELASRRLPAYYLGKFPDHNVISCSYAADLANRMNRDCQRIIDSPRYAELFPQTRLSDSGSRGGPAKAIRTDELFEVVGRAGSYRSAGVGGGITGMGFHLGIIDDPFKNFEESHSPTIREKVWEWYTSTFWTRQAPGARILVVTTRWHDDDLVGRLLRHQAEDQDADKWTVVRLPALADRDLMPEDDRQEGEALWPERFGVPWLATARASLGGYLFAGMYQQSPVAEGGNHFKEQWFKRTWRDGGEWLHVEDGRGGWERYHRADCATYVTCDPAASEKETADYTVIAAWCVTPHNDLCLLDIVRERLGVDGIVPKLVEVCARHKAGWCAVEATGFQVAIVNAARKLKGMVPIRELSHEGKGKLVRATPAVILAESGKIVLPQSASWKSAYLDELTRFTGLDDRHDDQVDVTAYAVWQMPRFAPQKFKPEPEERRPGGTSDAGRAGLWGRR